MNDSETSFMDKRNKTLILKAVTEKKKSTLSHIMQRKLKHLDMYGEKVHLLYKGKDSYKTIIGAVFTVLVKLIILSFIGYECYLLFTYKHAINSTKYTIRGDEAGPLYPARYGFDISFRLNKEFNESYGQILATQVFENVINPMQERVKQQQNLEIRSCNQNPVFQRFSNPKEMQLLSQYKCFDSDHFSIKGNSIFSDQYSYLLIQLLPCQQTNYNATGLCKSQKQIEDYLGDMSLKFLFVNTNYNFNDIKNPLQPYIDDSLNSVYLDITKEKKIDIILQEASTEVYSNFFLFWEKAVDRFVQVSKVQVSDHSINPLTKNFATLKLHLDRRSIIYRFISENFLDILEKVGGFKHMMFAIGLLSVTYFQKRLFKSSFFRQIYQTRLTTKEFQKKMTRRLSKDKSNSKTSSYIGNNELSQKSIKISSMEDIAQKTNDNPRLVKKMMTQTKLNAEQLGHVYSEVTSRRRFNYTPYDVIHFVLHCFCIRHSKTLKKSADTVKHFFFHRANKKIHQELDIVNLVRSIRKLKLMAKVILSQRSRILLKFQRKNLLESHSSSSDSDNHQYDTMKLLDNKNQIVRLAIKEKIKKSLTHLQESQMNEIDKNLIKGIYLKNKKQREEHLPQTTLQPQNTGKGRLFARFGSLQLVSNDFQDQVRSALPPILNKSKKDSLIQHQVSIDEEANQQLEDDSPKHLEDVSEDQLIGGTLKDKDLKSSTSRKGESANIEDQEDPSFF